MRVWPMNHVLLLCVCCSFVGEEEEEEGIGDKYTDYYKRKPRCPRKLETTASAIQS